MKRSLIAVLTGALITAAPVAKAQAPQSASATQDPPAIELNSAEDAQAVLDARILALKTVIALTPAQQELWPAVESAIRDVARLSAARRGDRAKAPPPANFLDILDRVADAEAARAHDLKSVTQAMKPLVASLTPEQQRRIPAFLGLRESGGLPQPTAEIWLFEEEN
jgi:hypothetical protein